MLFFAACAAATCRLSAQDADAESPTALVPGLVARYEAAAGQVLERVEARPQILPGQRPDELMLADSTWRVSWRGWLDVRAPGRYRISAWHLGRVRVTVAERTVLDASSASAAWSYATPVELPLGPAALAIEFTPSQSAGELTLGWEGPGFAFEPLSSPWLGHTTDETPDAAQGSFARGQTLFDALRCGACHAAPDAAAGKATDFRLAPPLVHLAKQVSWNWLVARLQQDHGTDASHPPAAAAQMPHLGLERAAAEAVAGVLWKASTAAGDQAPAPSPSTDESTGEQVAQGRAQFRHRGCLACHRAEGLGGQGNSVRYDLSYVGDKRPADYFVRWLRAPGEIYPEHLMPVFELSDEERGQLAAYLAAQRSEAGSKPQGPSTSLGEENTARGKALVARHRCGACHALPPGLQADAQPPRAWPKVARAGASAPGCLGAPQADRAMPGYALPADEKAELQAYLAEVASGTARALPPEAGSATGAGVDEKMSPIQAGEQLFERLACTACHARGLAAGLVGQWDALAMVDPLLAAHRGALRVPALDDVGDKLTDGALADVLARGSRRRPWLTVQMPRFRLTEAEQAALVAYLVAADRLPAGHQPLGTDGVPQLPPSPTETAQRQAALQLAGERLVTAEGFGCTSCHAAGRWEPPPGAPGTRGTDLSALGQRLREPWFRRWVRNPQRQGLLLEMPSLSVPVRGVLEERLEDQVAAVWHVLSQPGFTPPATGAVQIVRTPNDAGGQQRAVFVRDVFRVGKRAWPNVLVIGLPNRHNLLWDIGASSWSGWWLGDTARQRNEGKRWYWEPAGSLVWKLSEAPSELTWVLTDGRVRPPQTIGQWTTDADRIEHLAGGIRFAQRLRFANKVPTEEGAADGSPPEPIVRLVQSWTGTAGDTAQSDRFARRVEVRQFPPRGHLRLRVLPPIEKSTPVQLEAGERVGSVTSTLGTVQVQVIEPAGARLAVDEREDGMSLVLDITPESPAVTLEYRLPVASDRFLAPTVSPSVPAIAELTVVPGWRARRLPMPESIMPTGIAWRQDGSLVVTSLRGDVWVGRDADRDGLEDRWAQLSDQLSVPYGVAAVPDDPRAVDVSCKFGLVRLFDDDGDDRADRTEVLAAGWGHTDDYHDWAVGLPRDRAGHYYLGLACQQDDDRSLAGALGRGAVLRLTPRAATPDAPHRYAWEAFARGFRFPMGLTLDAEERLLVTDNQGNFTPFNELNHARFGLRYGFVNALERSADLPREHEPPAIAIPHPWTRSVNGICLLPVSPRASNDGQGSTHPFAGHLLGCEYDTRRLVRMSLQEVDGQLQGAVYPFSRESTSTEHTFQGPLVCQPTPSGGLLIGSIRDSGWGAGQNTGEMVRLDRAPTTPPSLEEVVARPHGFRLRFSAPLNPATVKRSDALVITTFRREVTPDYGGPDLQRRRERPRAIALSEDGRQLDLEFSEMRTGFVYEFHLSAQAISGEAIWPDEAYYTLHRLPAE